MIKTDEHPEILGEDEARQGVTGHNVRYVLFYGLALAFIAGLVIYLVA